MSRTSRRPLLSLSTYVFWSILTGIWFLPVFFIILNMFKENYEIFINPGSFPTKLRFDLVAKAWRAGNFLIYYQNSLYITVVSIVGALVVASLASYAFARLRFRGRQALFTYLLVGMMVPLQAIIISLYILLKRFGLLNTREGLILVYTAIQLPWTTYFLTLFFATIPRELEDAAIIDGCSRIGVLVHLILPLSRAALATMTIFLFTFYWSEFMLALTIISSDSLKTIPLGMMAFSDQFQMDVNGQISAVVFGSMPIIIVYFIFQKQFVRGVIAGALKG